MKGKIKRPRIGIVSDGMKRVPPYIRSIERGGGEAVILLTKAPYSKLSGDVDGLLLTGGGDVDPVEFGESPNSDLRSVNKSRDQMEIRLILEALQSDIPVLGICRGLQMMNVALKGTLVQDIASNGHHNGSHDDPTGNRMDLVHEVILEKGTQLHGILQKDNFRVNSIHHQAIGKLAPGLRVTGYADDGIIEAIELPGKKFFLGVQWHPEEFWENFEMFGALFRAFVAASTHK